MVGVSVRAALAKDLRGILEDPTYRLRLTDHLQKGLLSPALETMLWAYAYGKPTDHVAIDTKFELTGETVLLDDATAEPESNVHKFCSDIIDSPEFRRYIKEGIETNTLPPTVASKIFEYAFGKPPDKVEVTGPDGKPIETVTKIIREIIDVTQSEGEDQTPQVH